MGSFDNPSLREIAEGGNVLGAAAEYSVFPPRRLGRQIGS